MRPFTSEVADTRFAAGDSRGGTPRGHKAKNLAGGVSTREGRSTTKGGGLSDAIVKARKHSAHGVVAHGCGTKIATCTSDITSSDRALEPTDAHGQNACGRDDPAQVAERCGPTPIAPRRRDGNAESCICWAHGGTFDCAPYVSSSTQATTPCEPESGESAPRRAEGPRPSHGRVSEEDAIVTTPQPPS